MSKEKKTIIFIVEGSSDKAALENIFKKIYRRNKEIDFGFTNGDITSDPTVTIVKHILIQMDYCNSTKYKNSNRL